MHAQIFLHTYTVLLRPKAYMHTYIPSNMYTCVNACINTKTRIYIQACVHTFIQIQTFIHTYMHACTLSCLHTCNMHSAIHTCVRACMCGECVEVCVCAFRQMTHDSDV